MRTPRFRIRTLMIAVAAIGITMEAGREIQKSRFYRAQAELCAGHEESNRGHLLASQEDARNAVKMLGEELKKPGTTGQGAEGWRQEIEFAIKDIPYSFEWMEWWGQRRRLCERVAAHPWERLAKGTLPAPHDVDK